MLGGNFDVEEMLLCVRYNEFEDLKQMILDSCDSEESIRQVLTLTLESMGMNTCLHYAAVNGLMEIVEYLLKYLTPKDINMRNSQGNTPLHWAAYRGHEEIVKKLLENGADPNIKNENGKEAAFEAEQAGHLNVSVLLQKAQKEENIQEECEDEVDVKDVDVEIEYVYENEGK